MKQCRTETHSRHHEEATWLPMEHDRASQLDMQYAAQGAHTILNLASIDEHEKIPVTVSHQMFST